MKKLIGITGQARSGKDTFARAFVAAGYNRLAFADPIKTITANIAGERVDLYHDDQSKEQTIPRFGVTRREALQGVGHMVRDIFGDDVWVSKALQTWRDSWEAATIITDVRYPNEARRIRESGGVIIRVTRPNHEGLTGVAASHDSERGLPDDLVDFEVLNDGTVGDLLHEARKALRHHEARTAEHLGVDL